MFNALTKKYKEKRGFTLMEVLVVVAIIAVIAVISVTGILRIRENLSFRQKNDYAKTIFMAAQSHLTELRASNGLEKLEKDPDYILDALMDNLDNPDTAKVEYEDYCYTYNGHAAYNIVLPVGSVETIIREQNVIIEYNPKTGNVYSVYYSENDSALVVHYREGHLPRNDEGDEEKRRDMMLGYYDGSDLSGEELGLMHMKADIRFENGEEGLVTVIVPTQDEKDTSFSIADDGNYNRYMSGLTVKLTVVGEQSGFFETVIKEAGSFDSSSCYPSIDLETGAQVIHITFPIDSLKDNGSFADLAADSGIQPGDNVSVTTEVTYASSATDPIVEIEEAMVAGVNPMFHSLTTTSDSTGNTKYILTLSNGRNLQNLNLLHHDIAKDVESVLFVNPDGTITDVVIDWNDTVEYYNEKYGSTDTDGDPDVFTNAPDEAPGRALPHFVPIMNDWLLFSKTGENGTTIPAAKIIGNGVRIYDLNVDVSNYTTENGYLLSGSHYAVGSVSYENTGLFASANTSIDRISIVNPVIRGSSSGTTGALVGELQLNGTVSNCGVYVDTEDIDFVRSKLNMSSFDGSDDQYGVSGSGAVGGLIGCSMSDKTVESSFAAVPVYGTKSTSDYNGFGGLVGLSADTQYQKCYASGTVNAQSTANDYGAGGFVGTSNNSNYANCFATGDVKTSTGNTGCAGFVGVLDINSTLEHCYSAGLANLKEDFCGFYPSTTDAAYKADNYYLSQTELGYTNRAEDGYSVKCASVVSYEQLEELTSKSSDAAYNNVSTADWGSTDILSTHPYDIALGNNAYPFTMLKSGQTASGQATYMDYYGNWPRKPLDAGIAYYEVYNSNIHPFGFYFDREETSTLRDDLDVVSDGYMILSGNEDTVKIGSSANSLSCGIGIGEQTVNTIRIGDNKVYYIFPLTSEILDNGNKDAFYTDLTVNITTATTPDKPQTTTEYKFFYNPNVALSHYNPVDPVVSIDEVSQNNAVTAPTTVPSTIYIRTARQLAAVGENMASFWDENYIQQLDIDFNEYQGGGDTDLIKAPIGNDTTAFTGSYIGRKDDGSVPSIIGYKPATKLGETTFSDTGIFSVIGKDGVVRNLNIETGSSAISGGGDNTTNIGLLAGKNQGTIEKVNVTVNGNVTLNASATAGLLVGENSGKLINCQISQTAGTATLNAAHAGGLVGYVPDKAVVENCSVALKNLKNTNNSGILAGVFGKVGADVTISDIPFLFIGTDAAITSSGSAAGFVGESAGTIMDCSVRGTGSITAGRNDDGTYKDGSRAAGFAVKVTGGTVDGCVVSPAEDFEDYKNKTNSNLTISGASAAGFVVTNNAVTPENKNDCIRSCTALGTVTGTSDAAGFVVTNSGTIEYCMSNVDMTAGTVFAKNNGGTVKECYGWSVSGTLDSAEDGSQHYLGSYFVLSSNGDVSLFDFKGKHANDTTASLSLINVLNKLTGGANSSVWDKRGSYEAYPYDITLTTEYPYPMLREHCGDWSIPVDAYAYGVVYYEKYSDGGWGVDLINLSDECPLNVNRSIRDAQNSVPNVAEAGYALFCKANTDPFSEETNQLIGEPIPANGTYRGLYQVAGLDEMNGNDCIYGLYRLNSSDFEVTVSNSFSTQSVELVPLFADTLTHENSEDDKTDAPFRIRTQEHLENIKHLPAGKFVIDRCFSVDKSFSSIPTFSGELTGLDGAEVKATDIASGLINKANGAVIDGVKLTATMSVKLEPASLNVIGTLVNEATDSTITNCTIQTDIMVSTSEPAAQAEDSSEAESGTEASEPTVQKGTVTIGGIVGKMLGGTMGSESMDDELNTTVVGSIKTNDKNFAERFDCTVGGAVGVAGSNGNNQFGAYSNVSSNTTISSYIVGSIGEFVGFVYGGTFSECISIDRTNTREFLGGISYVPETVEGATHFADAPDGQYIARANNEDVAVTTYPNTNLINCFCYDSNDVIHIQEIEEDQYYFKATHARNDVPVDVDIKNPTLYSDDLMSGDYFIMDGESYHRVSVTYQEESINEEITTPAKYVFSYTDATGENKAKEWVVSDSGCTMLYTITPDIDLSTGKQYVIMTSDNAYVLYLVADDYREQPLPNQYSVAEETIVSVKDNLLLSSDQTISVSIKVPDCYTEDSGLILVDGNSSVSLQIDDSTTYTQFSLYEVTTSYEKVGTSYKVTFDVFTPAT